MVSRLPWTRNLLSSYNTQIHRLFDNFHTTRTTLAGHSKWANIKHIKAAKDGQRSIIFGRLTRQIRLAVQEGGSPNPQLNSVLKNVVDIALKKNMPMTTIQAAIKRSESSKAQFTRYCLDIKLVNTPIFLVCVVYTENLTGFKMQMAPILKKAGASLADARYLFDSRGVIQATLEDPAKLNSIKDGNGDEIIMADAIDCGAEDVSEEGDGVVNFICDPSDLDRVSRELLNRGYRVDISEHIFLPKMPVNVSDSEQSLCDTLRAKLKALDGVDEVYDNINIGNEGS